MSAQCYLTRVESFSACHRLHSVHLNNEENVEVFQKCNNPMGHGHNYKLEVTIRGPIDQRTDVEYFKRNNIVSTTENLAVFIWSQLVDAIPNKLLYKVKVWETEKNIVTYKGE
ncbi:unnamed protein product [Trichobilharzia szidati]|nr:unnamed protein product [Trichobilharzia szidati]